MVYWPDKYLILLFFCISSKSGEFEPPRSAHKSILVGHLPLLHLMQKCYSSSETVLILLSSEKCWIRRSQRLHQSIQRPSLRTLKCLSSVLKTGLAENYGSRPFSFFFCLHFRRLDVCEGISRQNGLCACRR